MKSGLEDDADLLIRSKANPAAFGEFYERHAEKLLAYFARRTLDPDAAAELTAETFAEAFASRDRYRRKKVDGAAWLYGIAKHELSHYFRSGAAQAKARQRLGIPERSVSTEDYERIEEMIDFEKIGRAIADALPLLTSDQREAMTLRVIEGKSYEEVASELSCSAQTARARVSRGLNRLASILESGDLIEQEG